jgi:hypothetical protein
LQVLRLSSVKQKRNETGGDENKLNNPVEMLRKQRMEETNKLTNYFKAYLKLYISDFVRMAFT